MSRMVSPFLSPASCGVRVGGRFKCQFKLSFDIHMGINSSISKPKMYPFVTANDHGTFLYLSVMTKVMRLPRFSLALQELQSLKGT